MIYETKPVSDQMNKVVDQLNNYTNDIFGLFSTITKQMEKLSNAGIENLGAIVESGQKIGKDSVVSATTSANQAIQAAQTSFKDTCEFNFIKKV